MNKGPEIARGKTKVLYEHPGRPDVLVVHQSDAISSGDGARRDEIPGKGRIAAKTTARVFRLLNLCGLPTHYLTGGEDDDGNEMLVRRCEMIPVEVVVRGVAAGSLVRRRPGIQKGAVIVPRLIEFFLKDDANHDPLVDGDEIVARGLASAGEIGTMSEIARIAYEILAHAWRRRETLLVDLKLEFGRITTGEARGQLVIADVIDNDSWRIWPQAREDLQLDKQMYRDLPSVGPEELERVRAAYETVAELVGPFPQMRPGMVALIADGPEHAGRLDPYANALAQFGLPTLRRIVNARLLPNYVLGVVQQLDASFARMVYVCVGGGGTLAGVVDAATTTPVMDAALYAPLDLANAVAKTFALDDSVMFGRMMLVQANARSTVVAADAQLNAPDPQATGLSA